MNEFSVNGIVLRSSPFKESSAVLTLLTAEHGRMSVVAQGVRKVKKSGLYAQPFSFSEFLLNKGRGMPVCRSVDLKETFFGLRQNMECLAVGQYFLETAFLVEEEAPDGKDFLKLLLNSLYLLSRSEKTISPNVIKLVYELKFMQLYGYGVQPGVCCRCGNKEAHYWNFYDGFYCHRCAMDFESNVFHVSEAVCKAINYILTEEGLKAYAFKMSNRAFKELFMLSEKYLELKTETHFKSLDFYSELNSDKTEREKNVL